MVSAQLRRLGGSSDAEISVIVDPAAARMSTADTETRRADEARYDDFVEDLQHRPPVVPVFFFEPFDGPPDGRAKDKPEYWLTAIDRVAEETDGHIALAYAMPNPEYAKALTQSAHADRVTSVLLAPFAHTSRSSMHTAWPPQLPQVTDVMKMHNPRNPGMIAEMTRRAFATASLRSVLRGQHDQLTESVRETAPDTHAGRLLGSARGLNVFDSERSPRATSVTMVAWGNPATCHRLHYTVERLPDRLEGLDPVYGRVPKSLRWSADHAKYMGAMAWVRLLNTVPDPGFEERALGLIRQLNAHGEELSIERMIADPRAARPRRMGARPARPKLFKSPR